MNKKIITLISVLTLLNFIPGHNSFALEPVGEIKEFIKNNPDGNKYEFTKAFITALEYIKANVERNENVKDINPYDLYDNKRIDELSNNITLDNVNWRIAKNMLKKYLNPQNGIMLKVADTFIKMCDEQIDLNGREKDWLDKIKDAQVKKKVGTFDQTKFLNDIQIISDERKESLKKMLESSMLASKVLISSQKNRYGELDRLGVSARERDSLLYKLENFYGDNSEGGLREGQSFLEASVTVLKEALGDYSFDSLDDR